MKIAILADDAASFVKPMADGLARMLQDIGEDPTVHYDGLDYLRSLAVLEANASWPKFTFQVGKDIAKVFMNRVFSRQYRVDTIANRSRLIDDLCRSDVVIVVAHLGVGFGKGLGVEKLREITQAPIILYDLINLAAAGHWIKQISDEGGFGLERYDWHLSASVVSETAMPRDFKAWSRVGLDIRAPSLYPQQDGFVVLLDFPRAGFESERQLQLEACIETGTQYIQLDEPMTSDDIRSIYRQASMFFLSFRERFGLPIVELQHCGSYIAAPSKEWVPSHYLKDAYEPGLGALSDNFIIYDGNKELLKGHIERIKADRNAARVVDRLKRSQPFFYDGDREALARFIGLIREKKITSRSHEAYSVHNDDVMLSA